MISPIYSYDIADNDYYIEIMKLEQNLQKKKKAKEEQAKNEAESPGGPGEGK